MLGNRVNLRHLRAFAAVAKHTNISVAAQEVFLSQPAITQAIAKLETIMETLLFDRRRNGMFVSETGEIFLNRVKRALKSIELGARLASRTVEKDPGRNFSKLDHKFDQLITSSQLRSLIAVAEAGNFSLAARAINISQPTLHRTARELERVCGMELFRKVSQGIELTAAAKVLTQHAQLAFYELEQGFEEIQDWRGLDTGRVSIGTMPLAQTYLIPTAVNLLLKQRPDVNISVTGGSYSDLLRGLRHGEFDMLIGALRDPLPIQDVIQEPLFKDPLAIIGRWGHPLANRKNLTLDDLAKCAWVVPRKDVPVRGFFDRLFNENQPVSIVEASSLITTRGILIGSDRLTIMSAHQIQVEENQELLCRLDFDLSETPRQIGLTLRQNWQPTASQSLMLQLLRETGHGLNPV